MIKTQKTLLIWQKLHSTTESAERLNSCFEYGITHKKHSSTTRSIVISRQDNKKPYTISYHYVSHLEKTLKVIVD